MNVHPKTVRRVMILIIGAGLIAAAVTAVVIVRQRQITAAHMANRAAGIAAVERGEYAAALEFLKTYVSKYKTDVGALVAYATARSRLEEPTGKHIGEGVQAFRTVLALDPNNVAAQHALLELFPRVGYNREAIELADAILAREPVNVNALRARAYALERSRRYDEAVAAYERLNEVAPLDLRGQIRTFELYRRVDRPPADVIARAEALLKQHPGDARFELLLGMAYGDARQYAKAREMLKTAAARPAPDATFVAEMAATFDRFRMFPDSQALLERAVADNPDPKIMRVLVQRLWQSGRPDLAAKRLREVQPSDPNADTQLLALRALALYETGGDADAAPIAAALAERKNDVAATAWATAFAVRFPKEPVDHKTAVAQYGKALSADPSNAVVRCWLGDAYDRVGETEPAIAAWRIAADLAPSWATPHENIARAYAGTGRAGESVRHAQWARQIAPGQTSAQVTYAIASSADLGRSRNPEKIRNVLRVVDRIQTVQPGEPETLPMYVSLLARAGARDRAVAVVNGALAKQPPHSVETLLRLASASRSEKLELEAPLFTAIKKQQPMATPRVALAEAGEMAASGKPLDGLTMLQDAARAAGNDRAIDWKLAIAQYREHIKDPAAADEWIALADDNPTSVPVQTAVLKHASSARGDRAFFERTIERMKELTGEEGKVWKLERARWLLGSDKTRDHADAVNTLSEIVRDAPSLIEPRLLLAAAFDKVGNANGAIKELKAAAELQPKSALIAMELAGMQQAQGNFGDARAALERAATSAGDLDAAGRLRLARMFAQGGDVARATELLKSEADRDALDVDGALLLAQLYRRQARSADAEAVYKKLLAEPAIDADTVYAAADFYAAQGNADAAKQALARLEGAQLRPGVRELVRASYAERYESRDIAAAHYAAATAAASTDASAWRQRIEFLIRIGRAGEAVAAADEAMLAVPNNERLRTLRVHADTVARATDGSADLGPLIESLAKDGGAPEAVEVLKVLDDARTNKLTAEQMLARLRGVGDRFPRYKPLQLELVRRYAALNNMREASDLAARAIETFPGDPEPAALAASVFRRAGQWKQMESASRKWRERSLDKPMNADAAIAEAQLAQRNVSGAVATMQPYVAAVSAAPERHAGVAAIAARALAAAGREDEARSLLEPSLLAKSPAWRTMSMSIAANDAARADHAAAWLDTIGALVPNNADDERLALAGAWQALGIRLNVPRAFEAARAILAPMAKDDGAKAEVHLLSAALAEGARDVPAAEAAYRKALAKAPNTAVAMNNLAYLLLTSGRDPSEAKSLAERAVALEPKNASFHDTLARAHLKSGDRTAALKSFEQALSADPSSLDALIGKAATLSAMGERDQVRKLLIQVDALIKGGAQLAPSLQRELELTRNGLNASIDPR